MFDCPIVEAAMWGKAEEIEVLLKYGANPNAVGINGEPIETLIAGPKRKQTRILEILKKHRSMKSN